MRYGVRLKLVASRVGETLPDPFNLAYWTAPVRLSIAIILLGSFLVYFITLGPTVFGLDSAEFSAAAYNLGVPHATGYPLYLLTGKLFTYIPLGDVGYRLNLMSAVFASAAIVVVYLLALLVTRRPILSMAAAGFLAFSYYFWASAVVAEVYAMHALLTATTIYLLLLWNREDKTSYLYGAGFVWGLSFGNHASTVLLAPAFAYMIALGFWRKQLRYRHLFILAFCLVIPLAVYIYLPLRYLAQAVPYVLGQYNEEGVFVRVDHTSIAGMWQTLTARQFGTLFFAYRGLDYFSQAGRATVWLFANFLGIGFVLGILGTFRNYSVDRQRLIFLGLVFVTNFLFFTSYGAPDKEFMFLPVYLVWSVWSADGIKYLIDLVGSYPVRGWARKIAVQTTRSTNRVPWEVLALLLPIAALLVNFSYTDVSSDTLIRDQSEQLLRSVETDALILARWPDEAPMSYLQIVEKIRPDVQIIDRFLITPENERLLIERTLPQRPVYVLGPLPVLSIQYDTEPVSGGQEAGHRLIPVLAQP